MESLTTEQFLKVQNFFETMPRLRHKMEVTNPNTKKKNECNIGGIASFFRVALSHNSLENYVRTNFAMMQHHYYSLHDLENMIPWEREVYVTMLLEYIKEENERIRKQQN